MRFLSMVRINERAGQRPDAQLMEDMGRLMAELTAISSRRSDRSRLPASRHRCRM